MISLINMILKRNDKGIDFQMMDFGDKLKIYDYSVLISLKTVGEQLIIRHSLSINDLMYIFLQQRFTFLTSLQNKFIETIEKKIFQNIITDAQFVNT